MTLGAMIRWLVVLLLGSIASLVVAARAESRLGVVLSVAAFAAAAVLVSARTNQSFWSAEPGATSGACIVAFRRNARLLALTYAWGALAMQALYTPFLTGLLWWPAWPIAMILATLGVLTSAFGYLQLRAGAAAMSARLRQMVRVWFTGQAWSAAILLLVLAGAGTRNGTRVEWGAAQILTFCCLAVLMQSMFGLRSHLRC